MTYFLAKTEPGTYSIDDLQRDRATTWDGVKNPQALRAIRQMKPADRVFIYHSGGQAAVVGLAEVAGEPFPDPKLPGSWAVKLKYLSQLECPTTLTDIKASALFPGWALVRQGRLSTMEAPDEFVTWMRRRCPNSKI